MINQVTLLGNLGRNPEVRTTESGTELMTFSLATSDGYKDKDGNWKDETDWHKVTVWKPSNHLKKLKKGNRVFVSGKIKYREYEGKWYTDIIASNVRTLDKLEETQEAPSRKEQELQGEMPF